MEKLRKLFQNEQGSAILIATFMILTILVFVSFVVDFGRVFAEKSHLQKATNSTALSGGRSLPAKPTEATDIAKQILDYNALTDSHDIQLLNNNRRIEVLASRNVSMSFARLIGIDHITVQTKSAAVLYAITKAKGVAPVGVNKEWYSSLLDRNRSYNLTLIQPDIGYTGILQLGDPGGKRYEEYLKYGYPEFIEKGERFGTDHGVKAGPTRKAIQDRLDGCPEPPNSYDDYAEDCSRVVLVPVYEPIKSSGTLKEVEIVGFALFYIEGFTSDNKGIKGKFINGVWPNSYGSEQQTDYGAYSIRLSL